MPAYRYKVLRKSDGRRLWKTPKISHTGSGHKEQITLIKKEKNLTRFMEYNSLLQNKENSDKYRKKFDSNNFKNTQGTIF